jgi:hypothetical protein
MTKEEMLTAIRELAKTSGSKNVPRHQFLRQTHVSERQIALLFGSYNGLVEAAGLEPVRFPTSDQPVYTDEELLSEVVRVLRLPNSKMTRIFFEQNASLSSSVCERRFGGWLNALRSAARLLDPEVDRQLIDRLNEYAEPRVTTAALRNPPDTNTLADSEEGDGEVEIVNESYDHLGHQFVGTDTTNVYGDFINFRGLQHAPVNEQGVVFLFGMICRELGYVVEIVKQGFPDCEAKRAIRGKQGKWQRVRIEFEYSSRSFRTHGHDPDQCDVIVCWEHNWPECPLEVLELRDVLASLPDTVR